MVDWWPACMGLQINTNLYTFNLLLVLQALLAASLGRLSFLSLCHSVLREHTHARSHVRPRTDTVALSRAVIWQAELTFIPI